MLVVAGPRALAIKNEEQQGKLEIYLGARIYGMILSLQRNKSRYSTFLFSFQGAQIYALYLPLK